MKDIEKEVVKVLSQDQDTIHFERPQSEEYSPLNQAVIEKDIGGNNQRDTNNWNPWKPKPATKQQEIEAQSPPTASPEDTLPEDAPEQPIGQAEQHTGDTDQPKDKTEEPPFELPTASAKQAADTILGMSNNFLAIGGGYFVKIKKHKDFYDYDEVVQLIDQQNEKNVNRIKLDKEDKALLKPIIVSVLKKKAKKLTPEQQLMGAIISIGLKKTQTVMEVRAENEVLVDRILDIIREEKNDPEPETTDQPQPSEEVDDYGEGFELYTEQQDHPTEADKQSLPEEVEALIEEVDEELNP